jgi:hypothetical protein
MQAQVAREAAPEEYPAPAHPLHRYGGPQQEPAQDFHQGYQQEAPFDEVEGEPDPSRYDEALYGQIGAAQQGYPREQAYSDDPFGYQDDYEEEEEEQDGQRGGGLKKVAAVVVLAILGTGAALGYRSYFGTTRSGEPPIIRADNSPTKIVPPTESAKVPDRLASSDGTEKIVPREEAPVDVNTRAVGPRVVFPPLGQNSNPPSPASTSSSATPALPVSPIVVLPPSSSNNGSTGTMSNGEPHRIKTLAVRGDQPDGTASASAQPPPATTRSGKPPRNSPSSANASANTPMALSSQAADSAPAPAAPAPRARVAAAATPVQAAPDSASASGGSSGYMVQVSSQKSEADAQASYKTLQTKFPSILGSHDVVINRMDYGGEKGTVYQARVGPFGSREEALQFCVGLKTAGGQCFVPKN